MRLPNLFILDPVRWPLIGTNKLIPACQRDYNSIDLFCFNVMLDSSSVAFISFHLFVFWSLTLHKNKTLQEVLIKI